MQKWKVGNTPVSYKASFPFFFSVAYEENFENLLSQARKSRNLLECYFTMTPREEEEIINLPLFPTVWFWVLLTHKHTDIHYTYHTHIYTIHDMCIIYKHALYITHIYIHAVYHTYYTSHTHHIHIHIIHNTHIYAHTLYKTHTF